MEVSTSGRLQAAVALVGTVALGGAIAAAQEAPRTPWGDPDLQGI